MHTSFINLEVLWFNLPFSFIKNFLGTNSNDNAEAYLYDPYLFDIWRLQKDMNMMAIMLKELKFGQI